MDTYDPAYEFDAHQFVDFSAPKFAAIGRGSEPAALNDSGASNWFSAFLYHMGHEELLHVEHFSVNQSVS